MSYKVLRSTIVAIVGLSVLPLPSLAQADASVRTGTLAQGWTLLAKGESAAAAKIAWQELSRNVHDQAALALIIDATLAAGGASSALSTYEQWLGSRKLENPYVLRTVSRAMLVETSQKSQSLTARLAALEALAEEGDAQALAQLETASSSTGYGETRVLAAIGNEAAVKRLLAQLPTFPGSKATLIDALGTSGSKLAIPALQSFLSDPNDLNRAAAADALSKLGATDAIPRIKPLLQDPVSTVKLRAAGALLRLNDTAGIGLLNELSSSEHAGLRLAAAKELATHPDGAWQGLVRNLTSDRDPMVRMEAARLIAPYDHPLASQILEGLMRDENPGLREAASGAFIDGVASDFKTLRALLRSGDETVRVKAAGRVLELTR